MYRRSLMALFFLGGLFLTSPSLAKDKCAGLSGPGLKHCQEGECEEEKSMKRFMANMTKVYEDAVDLTKGKCGKELKKCGKALKTAERRHVHHSEPARRPVVR